MLIDIRVKLSLVSIAFVGIILMSLLGCREVNEYRYKYVELMLWGGELGINVNGAYGKSYEKNGKKLLDYGFPYNLQFTYYIASNIDLSKMEIKNIVLVGDETGTIHSLQDIQSSKSRIYDDTVLIRKSAGPLLPKEYQYQNYILTATVVIYKGEEILEEQISVNLKTEYSKERRSDWFDKINSV